MATEQDLLADVIAHPADDAPRLAYAECLDAQGDLRGEFIRTQIELAHLAEGDPRRKELKGIEKQLFDRLGREKFAGLPGGASGFRFDRGFPTSIFIIGSELLKCADELFRQAPIDDLRIWRLTPDEMASVAKLPQLANLKQLDLSDIPFGNDGVIALTQCTHAHRLENLNLGNAGLGPPAAAALAGWQCTRGLKTLALSRNPLGDDGAAALAASPWLANLESLNLHGCSIRAAGAVLLAASPVLRSVTDLRLGGTFSSMPGETPWLNQIGDAGAAALAASPHVAALRALSLPNNCIGDVGAAALANSPALAALVSLDLDDNSIKDAGAAALATSPHLNQLKWLAIKSNGLTDTGCRTLAETPNLPALQTLGLDFNPVYSGETVQGTDWMGASTGDYPVKLSTREMSQRYRTRFKIE